ncbi:hypothetical protein C1H46_043820 [Malus baccata]|uniref:Translation initiation factor eIF2B subunit epsilon n=1 Tax=Malus baccata TaxID=106549 RepID=A0A540K914_MALBA|nr:hypothetical protein C1H46_043820 [Malus baccata]
MGAQKKGASRVSEDPEELARVLLPLVNVPMINYTLAWLESAGVEEVFVFCCAHSKQVIDYLESSEWFAQPNFTVTTIESHNSVSAGDALRIHGDFVLISGDTVSNMSLTQVLQEHKERRKKDSNAVMTIVIKRSKPSQITHQSRLGTDELFMATDPNTKQLLYYEDKVDDTKGSIYLDKLLIAENPTITLHNDKQDLADVRLLYQDCHIDICSPEVLSLFTDNFDYQHLRRHFLKGLLLDDIMGYKIFTHEIHSSYAARIDNFRSYDTVSKDIIQRWTYPLVPDVKFFGNSSIKLERQGMYRASDIGLSRSAQIGPFTVIGSGTKIGNNTKITNSVIGEGCSIGSNVSIEGSYIWDNATIEDGCKLRHAIVCDGVIMKSGAVLGPGVVLSFKARAFNPVVIGQKFIVPSYSKVSRLQQPTKLDSDDELEYADNSSGIAEMSSITPTVDKLNEETTNQRMETQCWPKSEGCPQVGELKPDSNDSEGDDGEFRDDSAYFEREVEATFLRAVHENIQVDHVILEVNSLRLSYNKVAADCAGALFYSMMKLALETPHDSPGELVQATVNIFTNWKKMLKSYLAEIDEEIEVILRFEEMCESFKEFSPVFDKILHQLYELEIIQEEAIMRWDAEKKNAEETDRVYVKQSAAFIQWLREAEEEEEDEEDEE